MKASALLAVAALIVPSVALADTGAVSLKEAVSLALANNHLLRAADYGHVATTEAVAASRSRYFPRVFLEEAAVVTNSPTKAFMFKLDEGRFAFGGDLNHPKVGGDFRTTFSLEQPLFDFSIGSGVDVAVGEEKARGSALARRREEVAFHVFTAYFNVLQARAHLRVAEQAVADAREHKRVAAVRSETGIGLKADELRARTFYAERELALVTAENDVRLAQLRLARAVGRGPGSSADAREEIVFAPGGAADRDELVRRALETRADLQEASSLVAKAESGMRVARSAYLPTVYGTASYQMNDRDVPFGRDNDAWMAGAVLRWELFDGLRRRHDAEKARVEKEAAGELLAERREEVALEVEESYLRRAEAEKRLQVARHALLDAEEDVRLVTKRFENSIATIVDMLDAQTALDTSRKNLADAEIASSLATARLYHAAGIFAQEVMK